jgi:hypothetical protein
MDGPTRSPKNCQLEQGRSAMITIDGPWFKDETGRTLLLRGVNLGGSSKVPYDPDGATYIRERFFDHYQVSFVGRPFPLEEADEHFSRLRHWGLTFLRFLVTWEAIEHAGPGLYDEAYLDYVYEIVEKAGDYGFHVFIDPHQDVWSRFSGGDGAPGWTFEAIGMDITKFGQTGAAIVHQTHGDPFPRMIWPTNGTKLAAATMFTLFFGGNDFAPKTTVEAEPVQEYLQRHYVAAIKQLALRLKNLPHVIGYDTMNEPLTGYIGWADLSASNGLLQVGSTPTPFQAMLLGAGVPQHVNVFRRGYTGLRKVGIQLINPERVRAWLPGRECVWRENGVWDFDPAGEPQLIRPDHFMTARGRRVDFNKDYYRPFANRYAREIRSVDPDAMIFIETEPLQKPPRWGPDDASNIVFAPHWYDGFVLYTKQFKAFIAVDAHTGRLVIGKGRISRSFAEQVSRYKQAARAYLGDVPTLIGEFGIAYDLENKRAYQSGDFGEQIKAMDRSFQAMEANLMSCTLWNYTADNTNARGDQWNDEDLSIFSRDQQSDASDIDSGGRALEAVVRPYAMKVAGRPIRMGFEIKVGRFTFEFEHDAEVQEPTEIFVPEIQYPKGCRVEVSDGEYEYKREAQIMHYWHDTSSPRHTVRLERA